MAERNERTVTFNEAKENPATAFAHPKDVLASDFTQEEKVEILRQWEYDAAEEAVAEEEGMPNRGDSMVRQVTLCLNELTGHVNMERSGANKQHGISDPALEDRQKKQKK